MRGTDPRQSFYLAISVAWLDGSLDLNREGIEAVAKSEKKAARSLKALREEYPDDFEGYVFHCVPVSYIGPGETKGIRLKP